MRARAFNSTEYNNFGEYISRACGCLAKRNKKFYGHRESAILLLRALGEAHAVVYSIVLLLREQFDVDFEAVKRVNCLFECPHHHLYFPVEIYKSFFFITSR